MKLKAKCLNCGDVLAPRSKKQFLSCQCYRQSATDIYHWKIEQGYLIADPNSSDPKNPIYVRGKSLDDAFNKYYDETATGIYVAGEVTLKAPVGCGNARHYSIIEESDMQTLGRVLGLTGENNG